MITKKQNEVIKEKTRKNKEMKKELRIYKRDISYLNAELDIMDERLYSYTATITDLEKQLNKRDPRDDFSPRTFSSRAETTERDTVSLSRCSDFATTGNGDVFFRRPRTVARKEEAAATTTT